ncbi:anoctamin-6 isoform X2 [Drosophila biarmipes]|nr:anoctamin-6 isoform X2 [Drosophila biarmipes]XP_050746271.1 anoctamin-6 isoform X2 [Drosophila biarmipes]XP_050746274.1 anoctamin-6 isoform X2 [Drosophila biarmipes]
MDERESLYFDTISLAESEAAAAAAAHRKSLSQSRNTIYHSAVDLAGDEGRASLRLGGASSAEHAALAWQPGYRQSTALEHLNGGGDHTDAAIAAQMIALQNGRNHLPTGIGVAGGDGGGAGPGGGDDEVSRRLLRSSSNISNKDKKLPITYSQWKSRTYRRFDDGKRSVDFVLAYNGEVQSEEQRRKCEIFEANLQREGLQLEHNKVQRVHFVKIHAPAEVLYRYAEILKIKVPLKPIPGQDQIFAESAHEFKSCLSRMCRSLFSSVQLNTALFPEREPRIHFEFARNYLELYDTEHPNFLDAGTRYFIINFILQRQHFVEGEETADNLGIEKLVQDGVYTCAYTLHDKDDRDRLLKEWANISKWKNLQPLDQIKDYFGAKVALYFAWLGFYTQMLIPISVFGVLCFLYGFVTWTSDPISRDICNDNGTIMCPQCDRSCDYWRLNETCTSSKFNYLIDNKSTVVFALLMSIWAVVYLEFWKRYSAGLVHRWGLTGFTHHVEHPRPQYLAKISRSRRLAGKYEEDQNGKPSILDPDVPFWSIKFLPNFTSYSIMILFICISVIAIAGIIIYRMAQRASHSILGSENSMTFKVMILPMTAGVIDLIVISLLDMVYSNLAVKLTNYEYCRTQTEYDESLTIKNYVFQFVNYYSSLFYIAFLKGKFVGYPAKYNRVLGFRQEECNPGGCLMELCMQLVIIMAGKQAVNAIVEMLIPYLMRTFKELSYRHGWYKSHQDQRLVPYNQFTEDYNLLPAENNSLYVEYLEMVVQFGFITLFSLAFPLAPLLALLNNVIEVRLDAIKMLRFLRRPVGMRARDIGVWHSIMTVVTRIAVASSAMIIAFSTNLIPKIVYAASMGDPELNNYLNFTLAVFNTKDFQVQPLLGGSQHVNETVCRYTEFRNSPEDPFPYKRPMIYWKILTGRLAFIVIYQNIITMLQGILRWAVPDVSGRLLKRIKRENFLLREHIIEYEKQHAMKMAQTEVAGPQKSELPSETTVLRRRDDATTFV